MKENLETVVFVSNFFNHHQRPFCDAMYALLGDGYRFLETEHISQERLAMGWGEKELPSYVISAESFKEQGDRVQELIDLADVVIFGSAPSELLANRIRQDKMIFRYSERPLKVKEPWKYPVRLFTWRRALPQKKHTYMLCASAYTAADFALFGLFHNKCYKWGYFPEVKKYDIAELMSRKLSATTAGLKHPKASILWAGRLIGWKHPDASIKAAYELKKKGYSFQLDIIGNGEMEHQLKKMIQEMDLSDCVKMLGAMSPAQVREHMEKADIFLFTSDRNEGWGAVLNESMNSGCAVIASDAIGSVPFLIKNGVNGVIYKDGNQKDLSQLLMELLDNPEKRKKNSQEAYLTMIETWNGEIAAERFVELSKELKAGRETPYLDGPCSKAERLFQWNVYKHCKGKIR